MRRLISLAALAVLLLASLTPSAVDAVMRYRIVSVTWDTTHVPGSGVQGGSSVTVNTFYVDTDIPADTFYWSVQMPLKWTVLQMRTALDEKGQAIRQARERADSLKTYEGATVNVP